MKHSVVKIKILLRIITLHFYSTSKFLILS